jgi:hypothetical protein
MGSARARVHRLANLKKEVVVRRIGKDATVLYEFRKTAGTVERS